MRRKLIKYVIGIIMLSMLCGTGSYALATSIAEEQNYVERMEKIVAFVSEINGGSLDAETIELTETAVLLNLYTKEIYARLIDIQDKQGNVAYIIMDINNIVIEYAEKQSVLFDNVEHSKEYYYSPVGIWAKDEYGEKYENINFGKVAEETMRDMSVSVMNSDEITDGIVSPYAVIVQYPTYDIIDGVVDYFQTDDSHCIPTSIFNIIAYWDGHGYPSLITKSISAARSELLACFVAAGGASRNASIAPAVESYVENNGNYNVTINGLSNPSFFALQASINVKGSPCEVGFPDYFGGGHATTGIGYQVVNNENYVIVLDTWNDNIYSRYVRFSEVDYITQIYFD